MKNIVIPLLSFLCITASGQKQVAINNYDSVYYHNNLIGWWKFTGNHTNTIIQSSSMLQVTPTEIVFYSGDSITRKTTYTLTTVLPAKRRDNTAYVSIHLASTDETWYILFFNAVKKSNSIIINMEPDCFCNCHYQVFDRLINSNFVYN